MPLPSPEQISELLRALQEEGVAGKKQFGTFETVRAYLREVAGWAAGNVVANGLGAATEAALGASGGIGFGIGPLPAAVSLVTPVSVPLFGVGSVVGAWLAAVDIIRQAPRVFALYDMRDHARASGGTYYRCSCGSCAGILQYMIDKKERKIAVTAVSPFLAGLPTLTSVGWSIAKSFQRGRPKEMHSRQLVASANGGCVNAAATIMMLCEEQLDEAIAIMLAEDGWVSLKQKW